MVSAKIKRLLTIKFVKLNTAKLVANYQGFIEQLLKLKPELHDDICKAIEGSNSLVELDEKLIPTFQEGSARGW
jgi:hypothetical protein